MVLSVTSVISRTSDKFSGEKRSSETVKFPEPKRGKFKASRLDIMRKAITNRNFAEKVQSMR